MGCQHKKASRWDKWCRPCAEKKAGPVPPLEWAHGDTAIDREGDSFRVMDSEMILYGIATEEPSWEEDLYLRSGRTVSQGTASLYTKAKPVQCTCAGYNDNPQCAQHGIGKPASAPDARMHWTPKQLRATKDIG